LLPGLKKEYEWLGLAYSQILQRVTLNLSSAFVNFFEGRAKYPNFKSKHGKQSIQYPQNVKLRVLQEINDPKSSRVTKDLNKPFFQVW
jgi:putative transposase